VGEKRRVTVDGEEFEVDLERDGDVWNVEIGGQRFSIQVEGGPSFGASRRSAGGGRGKKRSGTISSTIPGKVISLHVSVGAEVKEGDVMIILEAMKMQNEIQAPLSGTVTEVNCESGDSVGANVPLVVIEPPE